MSNTQVPYIVTDNSITVIVDGASQTVVSSHPNFRPLREAIKAKAWAKVKELSNIANAVRSYFNGKIEIRNGELFHEGEKLGGVMVDRTLSMMREGFDVTHLLRFIENVMANPSYNSRQQLYSFLENTGIPITPEGTFRAYKAVRSDYYSKRVNLKTGKPVYNGIGTEVTMDRAEIDDNPANTCAAGLHAGNLDYVKGYANGHDDRMVEVDINPRDVVSVPNDHNAGKLRACRYVVLRDYKGKLPDVFVDDSDDDGDYDGGPDELSYYV
jgi:hypothetical protein